MKPHSFFVIAILSLSASFGVSAARADTVDMAKLTCGELKNSYIEEVVVTGAWMSGYFNGKKGNTSLDIKKLSENTKNVIEFCAANPTVTVMDAVEKVAAPK